MVVGLLGPLEDGLHGLRFQAARGTGINRRPSELRSLRSGSPASELRARLGLATYRDADGVVEALELEEGEAPGRPGARVGDVEVVPPRHDGEPAVPGNGAPEGGRRPVEGAGISDLVQRRPRHLTRAREENRAKIQASSKSPQRQQLS